MYISPKQKQNSNKINSTTSNAITYKQYQALMNYKQYLEKEISCLSLEQDRDHAELDLLHLNVFEAIGSLAGRKEEMVREYEKLQGQLISEQEYSQQIQEAHVGKILLLKSECARQDEARRKQKEVRNVGVFLISEQEQIYKELDPNNLENGKFARIAEIQIDYRESTSKNCEQKARILELEQRESEKIELLAKMQENSNEVRGKIQLSEHQVEEIKQKSRRVEEKLSELSNLKIVKSQLLSSIFRQQSQMRNQHANSLETRDQIVLEQKGLERDLEVVLKDLEVEERGREQDEQKLMKQMVMREENRTLIRKLRAYLEELQSAHDYYLEILEASQKNLYGEVRKGASKNSALALRDMMNERPRSKRSQYEYEYENEHGENTCTLIDLSNKKSATSSTWNSYQQRDMIYERP